MKLFRVLIVEDDAMIAMLLAETVHGLGHEVCGIEATEADAVAAAQRFQPDMMIVDEVLGEGSGSSAVETILRTGFVPHVFVTGDSLRVGGLRPGAIILQKPFFERELVRAIDLALTAAVAS